MSGITLLYDTKEKDLARDLSDLLEELTNLKVTRIPESPDSVSTLQEKEDIYLKSSDLVIFLLTAGSSRDKKPYPSPSVCDEMGAVRKQFKGTPHKVIYLREKGCNIQAIDQKPHIIFERNDLRSILNCVTLLIKNLKAAGIHLNTKSEHKQKPTENISEFARNVDDLKKNICIDLSSVKNREAFKKSEVVELLEKQYQLNPQDVNFTLRDLEEESLVERSNFFYRLTDLGWKLARHESKVGKHIPDHAILKAVFGKQELINESRLR